MSIGRGGTWILSLVLGLVELGVGVWLLRNPAVAFEVLILVVGFMLVFLGVLAIIGALSEAGNTATSKALSIMGGVVAIAAGIVMFFQPVASGAAFVWVIGLFALINGPIWIAMSLDVKRLSEDRV